MAATALHNKLLTDISDELVKDSPEYDNFVFHMTEFVKEGLLSSKKTLLGKFGAMKTKGKLDVGEYECIKKVAESSGNNDLCNLIKEREAEIIEALEREKTGQKSDKSVSTKRKGTEVSSAKKRKLEEETDQSDPLYGRDDRGRGFYDTAGRGDIYLFSIIPTDA
ncbi:uncharacterized protein LOC132736904 [Ruditapes philippinarum]|uniref:uncharacterized protein LOC132736904 n=1 Tax=Ruditapes philippinarum TaxID=129788 RepID=UPI00295BBDEA|nr:uncharacterized protein LOC132736904 [Ruditapes philippinarum]